MEHRVTSFVQPVKLENVPSSMAGVKCLPTGRSQKISGNKSPWEESIGGVEGVPELTEPVLPAGLTHHDDVPVIDHRQLKQRHCAGEGENTHR